MTKRVATAPAETKPMIFCNNAHVGYRPASL